MKRDFPIPVSPSTKSTRRVFAWFSTVSAVCRKSSSRPTNAPLFAVTFSNATACFNFSNAVVLFVGFLLRSSKTTSEIRGGIRDEYGGGCGEADRYLDLRRERSASSNK